MIEFAGHGEGLITKEPHDQRYISVIRVRDGHITHYKDYWNPLALLRPLKGEEVMKAVASAPSGRRDERGCVVAADQM
jgi:hypothetical protein